jgi:hypothetical protein
MTRAAGVSARATRGAHRRAARPRTRRLLILAGGLVCLLAAAGGTISLWWPAGGRCGESFVPGFFPAGEWSRLAAAQPLPAAMVLDLTASGAGPAPDPGYQRAVSQVQAKGVQVLGYVDTSYGQRPLSAITAEARHYRAWYHVTSIFLDQVTSDTAGLGYYRAAVSAVRAVDPGAAVWLNPGNYPAPGYLDIASVVMVYEGPFSSYQHLRIPTWARAYPAARFAHNVYATPGSQLTATVRLAASRNAGHLYITDRSGANPYDGLPTYWPREHATVSASCGT